ncbi:hypothetical protein [Streptantibioticus ferralitis]|uniref:Uncharacterized protein n=1 Tax=Streptantibioticus ferralitis TaxID=236510 RepID=A0ABT5Z548_9ACTN|nr:hypothetical protein [Streptantibioticus ferralitis]MDF2258951.1 hypothetical protein [Streptantibioticus ferralitis]
MRALYGSGQGAEAPAAYEEATAAGRAARRRPGAGVGWCASGGAEGGSGARRGLRAARPSLTPCPTGQLRRPH